MESISSLTKIADGVLTRHITKCNECQLTQYKTGDNWKPCPFHRGFVAGIIAMLNQIYTELESVGFDG
jgi:hypothetical protein